MVFEKTKERVHQALKRQGVFFKGGKTTFDISHETGLAYTTVVQCLPILEKEGRAYRINVKSHSRETKRVREKIKQEHPELAMIPFPNMKDEEKDEY